VNQVQRGSSRHSTWQTAGESVLPSMPTMFPSPRSAAAASNSPHPPLVVVLVGVVGVVAGVVVVVGVVGLVVGLVVGVVVGLVVGGVVGIVVGLVGVGGLVVPGIGRSPQSTWKG